MLNEIPNWTISPPSPIQVQGKLEYEITKVLDSKLDRRRTCNLLYYIQWLGYKSTDEEYSWLSATELEHAKDLIFNFYSAYLNKPCL